MNMNIKERYEGEAAHCVKINWPNVDKVSSCCAVQLDNFVCTHFVNHLTAHLDHLSLNLETV